jgi:hypothetical protein
MPQTDQMQQRRLDLLVLIPEVRSLRQLELLSEHVLREYRH